MSYTPAELDQIFAKTGGRCRCCGKQLVRDNYGKDNAHGAWEVDHAIPVSRGGTNNMENLWPMCPECNQRKGDQTWSEFKGSCSNPIN